MGLFVINNKYFALPPAGSRLLEVNLNLRLGLALLAEEMDVPYVYTPIESNAGICASAYPTDVLNRKWEEYFRLLAKEFRLVDELKGEVLMLDEECGIGDVIFLVHPVYRDSLRFADAIVNRMKAFYGKRRHKFLKNQGVVGEAAIRRFTEKAHRAYVETFAPETRAPFENNTLRAAFLIENEKFRMPFILDKLTPMLELVAECARRIGSDLEVQLFDSLEFEEELPDDLQRQKEEQLAAVCSRPCVSRHQSPLFEELINGCVSADLVFLTETHYTQCIFGSFLMLLSNPKQVRLETAGGLNQLALNNCFLLWDRETLICEHEKLINMLAAASAGTPFKRKRPASFQQRLKRLPLISRKSNSTSNFNVASGVVDGMGSYFMKSFLLQAIADHYNLTYVHVAPAHFDHAAGNDPGRKESTEDFLMLGRGYPSFEEVFGERCVPFHYFRLLPPLAALRALNLTPAGLVASKTASFEHWPVPKKVLQQKILSARTAFQAKHRHYKDCFDEKVLNLAVHIRKREAYGLPEIGGNLRLFKGVTFYEQGFYFDLVNAVRESMHELQVPFQLHVYSDDSRQTMQALGQKGVQLHLAEDAQDHNSHWIEMSRADVLFLSPSSMGYAVALLSQPDQITFMTKGGYEDDESNCLLSTRGKVEFVDRIEELRDAETLRRMLGYVN